MKSEILLTLIKEVVKNEVKQQVKEELTKLIKSGAVTLNSQKKATPSLAELTEVNTTIPKRQPAITTQQRPQQQKEFTKDPMINEILNMTTPFTAAQRAEGAPGMAGGSVLDMLQPQQTMEEDWETMDYRMIHDIPQNTPNFQPTGDSLQDATLKALTRDYSALTKVFAEQEKQKKGR
jgi:hypothetical protein